MILIRISAYSRTTILDKFMSCQEPYFEISVEKTDRFLLLLSTQRSWETKVFNTEKYCGYCSLVSLWLICETVFQLNKSTP